MFLPVLVCQSLLAKFIVKYRGILVAQTVNRLPTMWEIQVQSLGQEDPLEKELTAVLLLRKSQGQRSVVGYSP